MCADLYKFRIYCDVMMSQLFRRAKDSEFRSCAVPGRSEIPDANMDPSSGLGVCDSIIFVVSCFLIYCILLWCFVWCVFYFVRRFFYVNWWFGGLLSEYSGWKSFDEKTLFNLESSNFNLLDNVPRRQVPWHVDGGNGGFGSIKVSATFEDSTWAQIFAEKGEMREESWKEKWIKLRKLKTFRNLWILATPFMGLNRSWAELLS